MTFEQKDWFMYLFLLFKTGSGWIWWTAFWSSSCSKILELSVNRMTFTVTFMTFTFIQVVLVCLFSRFIPFICQSINKAMLQKQVKTPKKLAPGCGETRAGNPLVRE